MTGVQRCDEILRLIDQVLADGASRPSATVAPPEPAARRPRQDPSSLRH